MIKLGAALLPFRNLVIRNKPFYAYFYVTRRCNLSCRMCSTPNYLYQEKELDISSIRVLANNLKKIGVGVVCLTGGEPVVREDLPLIIRAFSKQGLLVHLQTNGLNVSRGKIKEVIEAGCDAISVSLHSLNPQKQDYISGQVGAWEEIIKTLANIIAETPQRLFLRTLTTVVSPYNLKELPDLVRFATRIGFYIFLMPCYFPGFQKAQRERYFLTGKETSAWIFKPTDFGLVDSLYQQLIEMKREGFNIYDSFRFLRESIDYLKYGDVPWKDNYLTCGFPGSLFFISVDGHFHICVFEKFNDLSLLNLDFPEIFYSKEFRDRVKEKVRNCKGCMCSMTETFLLSKDLGVLLDKIIIGIKLNCKNRKKLSYDEILRIIAASSYTRQSSADYVQFKARA